MNKFLSKIRASLRAKIITVASLLIFIFLITVIGINFSGLNDLEDNTLDVVESELEELSTEYYENYLGAISIHIEDELEGIFDEIHILTDIVQTVFENKDLLDGFITSMSDSDFFKDKLEYSGSWYQNTSDEPTSLLVVEYMIDENKEINDDANELISNTRILDLILPAFAKYGVNKVQVYFQGGENKEIFRIAPWSNLGEELVDVYPEIFTAPVWETFNPGLAKEWRDKIIESKGDEDVLNSLFRVTPPVQDGLSGEFVLTISQPISNDKYDEFEGTVSYDLPITNIIDLIENVEISESGFAFISQADGNIFGINEQGLNTLGLLNDVESTIDSESGFNKLERRFENSSFDAVRSIELNNTFTPKVEIIVIDGKEYLLASKSIKGYQSWSPESSFFQENWQIGFVVPKEEVYNLYFDIETGMNKNFDNLNKLLIFVVASIAIIIFVVLFNLISRVTRDLTVLANAANEVKENNYNIDVVISSKDEVGILARAFTDMVGEIKKSFIKLEEQNIQLRNEIVNRKQKDRVIDYLENFDSGTDLPNKKALLNILKNTDVENINTMSLVIIGIDEFRKINEAYSWSFGDKLMKEISDRLNKLTLENGTLFKLSGDEFAYIARDNSPKSLITLIEDMNESLFAPFYIEDNEIIISASIGISSFPYDTDEPIDLFKFAIKAMIHAKEVNKGNYEFYNSEINTTARDRMTMISELRNAVENNELYLNYQPIIRSSDGKVTGMEALLRWKNPNLGMISPNVFIPIAEKSKAILPIGNWVIKTALQDTKKLHDLGYPDLNIAINVSIVQFLESDLAEVLRTEILSSGIDADRITIEITEGLFINDLEKILFVLNEIRDLGIDISVDDFGTGYSSLSYIKNLPISKLKVDRSFINEMTSERGKKITDAIIALAINMNFSVIAEGVETVDQYEYLKKKECDEVQGYLFSRPIDFDSFEEYLKSNI